MRGARKVQRPNPGGRRFPDTKDDAARAKVRQMRCLISGKRTTVQKWTGTYPKVLESFEVVHVCAGGPSDPHHPTTKARGGKDNDCIPLCRAAHDELHYMGARKFGAKWSVDVSGAGAG